MPELKGGKMPRRGATRPVKVSAKMVGGLQLEGHRRKPCAICSADISKGDSLERHPDEIQKRQVGAPKASSDKSLHEVAVIHSKQRKCRKVFHHTHRVHRKEMPHMLIPARSDIRGIGLIGGNTEMKRDP